MMHMMCVSDKNGNLVLVVGAGEYGHADFGVAGV